VIAETLSRALQDEIAERPRIFSVSTQKTSQMLE